MKEKLDYSNWVSVRLIKFSGGTGGVLVLLFLLSFWLKAGTVLLCFQIMLAALALFFLGMFAYMSRARWLLSYDGGGVQGKILDNVLRHLEWDGNGTLLDIGCGSGALAIKAAKKYPQAKVAGVDYWGVEWDFAQSQCESNARIEAVSDRTVFQKGDAANLDFPNAYFDAVISNFVFHEVRSQPDKLALIREALRVLKPGGAFALEDIFFSKKHYPDMSAIVRELSKEVSEIQFVDTRENDFVPKLLRTPLIAGEMGLIYGRK